MLHKTLALADCEVKLAGDSATFAGYASVFGGVDSYGDTILRGAFDGTLTRNGRPKMFYNHEWDMPIGKWLKVKEDDHGLWVEGELTPGNQASEDVRAALKHGTVDGLSIGYRVVKELIDRENDVRQLKEIDLWEGSPCVFQACPDAEVAEVKAEMEPGQPTPPDNGKPELIHLLDGLKFQI